MVKYDFTGKVVLVTGSSRGMGAAILEAFEHSKNGTPTQVVCIDDQLAIEIVWTYGIDPDPPAAHADTSAETSARGPTRPTRMPAH